MTDPQPRHLFDGMRFFVTQCAMKTLQRIDENYSSNPDYSDLILNMLMRVGGMVIESQALFLLLIRQLHIRFSFLF
jgi:hypothetical protein